MDMRTTATASWCPWTRQTRTGQPTVYVYRASLNWCRRRRRASMFFCWTCAGRGESWSRWVSLFRLLNFNQSNIVCLSPFAQVSAIQSVLQNDWRAEDSSNVMNLHDIQTYICISPMSRASMDRECKGQIHRTPKILLNINITNATRRVKIET